MTGAEIASGSGFAKPPAIANGESSTKSDGALEGIDLTTTVSGQLQVHFDSNMFKSAVIELLSTTEAKKKYKDIGLIASEGG